MTYAVDHTVATKVSIILIVRNGGATIRMALASLLSQTFTNWECVIVDDASEDSTRDILTRLSDNRFKVIFSDQRLGRGAARQRALSEVSGTYVTALDADDFFFPQKIELQVNVLEADPELVATVAGILYLDRNLEPLGLPRGYYSPGPRTISDTPSHLRLPFGGIMFRRDRVGSLVYADQPRGEDRQFFTRLLSGQKIFIEPHHTYGYRWEMRVQDVLLGLEQGLKFYLTMQKKAPIAGCLLVLYTRGKMELYRVLWYLGLWPLNVRLRYREAPQSLVKDTQSVLSTLRQIKASL